MKKIVYIFLFSLLFLTSCVKEILDKEPLGIISENVVWKDQQLINAFLNQCYIEMHVFNNESPNPVSGSGGFQQYYMVDNISDECKAFAVWSNNAYQYKFGALKINGGLLEWWEVPYNTIRKLNEFIERVPTTTVVDDAFKKQWIAEARFLRAFNYFFMVKRYGGVPLVTKVQGINDPKEELYPERNTEQEVYDFVLSEMDAIASDLPETYAAVDYGRPTRYAALALKCRAALYAASIAKYGTVQLNGLVGIYNSLASSYYQKSYDAAKLIMNSGKHALYNVDADKVTNFRNIFMVERNTEAIFVRQHDSNDGTTGGNGWNYDFFQCPGPNAWNDGNTDCPYLEMVEEFEHVDGTPGTLDRTAIQTGLWTTEDLWVNKEPRFFASIYTMNTMWKGAKLDYHWGLLKPDGSIITSGSYNGIAGQSPMFAYPGRTSFGALKYCDESKDAATYNNSKQDWIVFRYAEVLLNYAEAAFELGKPVEALDAVNQLRKRAGVALRTVIDMDKIRHERKVELAFEGHRYWDVRRWRIATTVLSRDFSGLRYVLDSQTGKFKLIVLEKVDGSISSPVFYPMNYYFPITLKRTANNPNLIENPGYE